MATKLSTSEIEEDLKRRLGISCSSSETSHGSNSRPIDIPMKISRHRKKQNKKQDESFSSNSPQTPNLDEDCCQVGKYRPPNDRNKNDLEWKSYGTHDYIREPSKFHSPSPSKAFSPGGGNGCYREDVGWGRSNRQQRSWQDSSESDNFPALPSEQDSPLIGEEDHIKKDKVSGKGKKKRNKKKKERNLLEAGAVRGEPKTRNGDETGCLQAMAERKNADLAREEARQCDSPKVAEAENGVEKESLTEQMDDLKLEPQVVNQGADSYRSKTNKSKAAKQLTPQRHPVPEVAGNDFFGEVKPHPQILAKLEEHSIYPLRKKTARFPQARFFCRLCEYHCDSVAICERHIKDSRHQRNQQDRDLKVTLKNLPDPCKAHTDALTDLLVQVELDRGLSDEELDQRRTVVERVDRLVQENLPDCRVRMFGSSKTTLALKTSDLNIDLVIPPKENPATIMKAVFNILKQNSECTNVKNDFLAKIPSICFLDASTEIYACITLNNESACQTSSLLAGYARMDSRVRTLGIAFRYWAKLCWIDAQAEGTLPSYAYNLMLIYFLQQHKPRVLPIMCSTFPKDWKCENFQTIGELWVNLFKFYSVLFKAADLVISILHKEPLTRTEKNWGSSKKIAIEDPYIKKRNLARYITNHVLFEYIVERFHVSYKYFGIPRTKEGPLFNKLISRVDDSFDDGGLTSKNSKPVLQNATVLMDIIKDIAAKPIQSTKASVTDESDDEDEITVYGKVDRDKNVRALREISTRMQRSSRYPNDLVKSPEKKRMESGNGGELTDGGMPFDEIECDEIDEDSEQENCFSESIISAGEAEFGLNEDVVGKEKDTEPNDNLNIIGTKTMTNDSRTSEVETSSVKRKQLIVAQIPPEVQEKLNKLEKHDLTFYFTSYLFTAGKKPALICSICLKEGHLKQNCPLEKLPDVIPLPKMDPEFMAEIDIICSEILKQYSPSKEDLDRRQAILDDLQTYIKQIFEDAKLELFGSSCNGFGFANSDMDICLTFTEANVEELNFVSIIEKLAEKLKKHSGVTNVIAITTAKVPIVKFTHRKSKLDGDISLYNTLAQHNTRMLKLYSELDPRVKMLGYTMKHFAKLCDIGDASRGSLSSYAYILMVIYFLQQRDPPIIPVLQELYEEKDPPPECIIEGCNAWFFQDIEKLDSVWQLGAVRNKESIGQLWLGLLRFYTEEFNFKEDVIAIRQLNHLTRFEKLWNSKCIAIEDPFDHQHNLGAGVSRKMNNFIMKAFIRGRHLFGTPLRRLPCDYKYLHEYLFDPIILTDGMEPPNDRGCRLCRKIGHVVKDCPGRKGNWQFGNEGNKKQTNNKREVMLQRSPANNMQLQQQMSNLQGRPGVGVPLRVYPTNPSQMGMYPQHVRLPSGIVPLPFHPQQNMAPMNFMQYPPPRLAMGPSQQAHGQYPVLHSRSVDTMSSAGRKSMTTTTRGPNSNSALSASVDSRLVNLSMLAENMRNQGMGTQQQVTGKQKIVSSMASGSLSPNEPKIGSSQEIIVNLEEMVARQRITKMVGGDENMVEKNQKIERKTTTNSENVSRSIVGSPLMRQSPNLEIKKNLAVMEAQLVSPERNRKRLRNAKLPEQQPTPQVNSQKQSPLRSTASDSSSSASTSYTSISTSSLCSTVSSSPPLILSKYPANHKSETQNFSSTSRGSSPAEHAKPLQDQKLLSYHAPPGFSHLPNFSPKFPVQFDAQRSLVPPPPGISRQIGMQNMWIAPSSSSRNDGGFTHNPEQPHAFAHHSCPTAPPFHTSSQLGQAYLGFLMNPLVTNHQQATAPSPCTAVSQEGAGRKSYTEAIKSAHVPQPDTFRQGPHDNNLKQFFQSDTQRTTLGPHSIVKHGEGRSSQSHHFERQLLHHKMNDPVTSNVKNEPPFTFLGNSMVFENQTLRGHKPN